MSDNRRKFPLEARLERAAPWIAAVSLVVAGGLATGLPVHFEAGPKIEYFFSHLGIGLIAAGILTAVLEPISRKRIRRDIEEIREAHFESLLKGFMPDEVIFKAVQSQIVQQPFLRSNFTVTLELNWLKDKPGCLSRSSIVSYRAQNKSPVKQTLTITAEDSQTEEALRRYVVFEGVEVEATHWKKNYSQSELEEEYVKREGQIARLTLPIELKPDDQADVTIRRRSVVKSTDTWPIFVVHPTVSLTLTVSHPENLSVKAERYHPSAENYKQTLNGSMMKEWKIDTGLLPNQGITVNWWPSGNAIERRRSTEKNFIDDLLSIFR